MEGRGVPFHLFNRPTRMNRLEEGHGLGVTLPQSVRARVTQWRFGLQSTLSPQACRFRALFSPRPMKNGFIVQMKTTFLFVRLLLIGAVLLVGRGRGVPTVSDLERARVLQHEVPMTDGHNDLPWEYRANYNDSVQHVDLFSDHVPFQTNIPRLREGEVGAQFWYIFTFLLFNSFETINVRSVFVGCDRQGKDAVRATLEQIDVVYKLIRRWPQVFQLV